MGTRAACAAQARLYVATRAAQGHEDLRQDERVMQLFGLVNTMLAHDRTTAERDLSIARYAVIPLSPNSGAGDGRGAAQPCLGVIPSERAGMRPMHLCQLE